MFLGVVLVVFHVVLVVLHVSWALSLSCYAFLGVVLQLLRVLGRCPCGVPRVLGVVLELFTCSWALSLWCSKCLGRCPCGVARVLGVVLELLHGV